MKKEEELCLLSNVKKSDVFHEPFPHIIIRDTISPELIEELIKRHPPLEVVTKRELLGSNKRFDYTVKDIQADKTVDTLWSDFIQAQAGKVFLSKIFELFGEDMVKLYPKTFPTIPTVETFTSGTRFIDSREDQRILLDAHISVNSPVVDTPDSVRAGHVDDPRKLYSGLFYMRRDNDDSKGGDLELYQFKRKKFKMYGQGIDDKYLKLIKTVPYEKNVLVLFLNSIDSLHGVTVREKTEHPRYFVNLIGELKEPLFDIKKYQEGVIARKLRRIKKILPKLLK